MQPDLLTVTTLEAARALQNAALLGHFLEPASPSDVAKKLDMPANLVHHHAKGALEAGILLEVRREGGKVFYQLAARSFRHTRTLLPPGGHDDPVENELESIKTRFLDAYTRCDASSSDQDPDYSYHGFGSSALPPLPLPKPVQQEMLGHPAHLQVRTLRLSTARYAHLMGELYRAITLEPEQQDSGQLCTVVVLGFEGSFNDLDSRGQTLSSFVELGEEFLPA